MIGVVSDAHYRSLRETVPPTMYGPLDLQGWTNALILHVRSQGQPAGLIPRVRQVLFRLDPRLSFHEVRTLAEEVEISLWNERMTATLSIAFAAFAAVAASFGLFALLAYVVIQRTREIGIRVAVGAERRHILGWIGRMAAPSALFGFAFGLTGLFVLANWMKPLLYDVSPQNIQMIAPVGILIFLIACLGTTAPAMRALRVQPSVALRHEE